MALNPPPTLSYRSMATGESGASPGSGSSTNPAPAPGRSPPPRAPLAPAAPEGIGRLLPDRSPVGRVLTAGRGWLGREDRAFRLLLAVLIGGVFTASIHFYTGG